MGFAHKTYDIGYLETLSAQDTFLHRLDPRAMVVTIMTFIVVVVSFNRYSFLPLIPFLLFPVVLMVRGRMPIGYIIKKVLLVSPFAVVIGIFNPIIDQKILFHIGDIGISGGWLSFMSIMLRFILTVTTIFTLIAIIGFNAVCSSLIRFGIPKIFVMQLLFCYRYVFVLTEESNRMVRARQLRTFKRKNMKFSIFISLIGNLLLRTLDRAEAVYRAMLCRGFDGDIHLIRRMHIKKQDILFMGGWILIFIICRYYNIPQILGNFVVRIIS